MPRAKGRAGAATPGSALKHHSIDQSKGSFTCLSVIFKLFALEPQPIVPPTLAALLTMLKQLDLWGCSPWLRPGGVIGNVPFIKLPDSGLSCHGARTR